MVRLATWVTSLAPGVWVSGGPSGRPARIASFRRGSEILGVCSLVLPGPNERARKVGLLLVSFNLWNQCRM